MLSFAPQQADPVCSWLVRKPLRLSTLFGYLFPTSGSSPLPTTMYPNTTVYLVQYNNTTGLLSFWSEDNPSQGESGGLTVSYPTSDARFFVIQFIDPAPQSTNPVDPINVSKISILNKAFELSQVVQAIISITGVPKVNILAHSMGGLDARAYAENMASPGSCYDYSVGGGSNPDYTASTCTPGAGVAAYGGDVANIITVDTPAQTAHPWQTHHNPF